MDDVNKQNYTAPRPWYGKKADYYELADSSPYGENTEAAVNTMLGAYNPKFMGFRKLTFDQKATMMASQGLSDQEIRGTMGKIWKDMEVTEINWQFTGE